MTVITVQRCTVSGVWILATVYEYPICIIIVYIELYYSTENCSTIVRLFPTAEERNVLQYLLIKKCFTGSTGVLKYYSTEWIYKPYDILRVHWLLSYSDNVALYEPKAETAISTETLNQAFELWTPIFELVTYELRKKTSSMGETLARGCHSRCRTLHHELADSQQGQVHHYGRW